MYASFGASFCSGMTAKSESPSRFACQRRTSGGQQVALPGLDADRVSEQRVVVSPPEAVGPAILLVRPADRQVGARLELVVDDRAVADGRPEQPVAAVLKSMQQRVEAGPLEDPGIRCRLGPFCRAQTDSQTTRFS